jgi:hypothetical protein
VPPNNAARRIRRTPFNKAMDDIAHKMI